MALSDEEKAARKAARKAATAKDRVRRAKIADLAAEEKVAERFNKRSTPNSVEKSSWKTALTRDEYRVAEKRGLVGPKPEDREPVNAQAASEWLGGPVSDLGDWLVSHESQEDSGWPEMYTPTLAERQVEAEQAERDEHFWRVGEGDESETEADQPWDSFGTGSLFDDEVLACWDDLAAHGCVPIDHYDVLADLTEAPEDDRPDWRRRADNWDAYPASDWQANLITEDEIAVEHDALEGPGSQPSLEN